MLVIAEYIIWKQPLIYLFPAPYIHLEDLVRPLARAGAALELRRVEELAGLYVVEEAGGGEHAAAPRQQQRQAVSPGQPRHWTQIYLH